MENTANTAHSVGESIISIITEMSKYHLLVKYGSILVQELMVYGILGGKALSRMFPYYGTCRVWLFHSETLEVQQKKTTSILSIRKPFQKNTEIPSLEILLPRKRCRIGFLFAMLKLDTTSHAREYKSGIYSQYSPHIWNDRDIQVYISNLFDETDTRYRKRQRNIKRRRNRQRKKT